MIEFNSLLGTTLIIGVIVSLLTAIIGPFIVYNRLNYFSSAFAHSSLGGIGIGLFFGIELIFSIQLFAIAIGIVFALAYYFEKERLSSHLDLIYSFGMSLGMLLITISYTNQYNFSSFLFGTILLTSKYEIIYSSLLLIGCLIYLKLNYSNLILICFDIEFAKTKNINVKLQVIVFFFALAILLPLLIRTIGITVTISLLTVSPLLFEKHFNSVLSVIIASALLNIVMIFMSIYISFSLDLPLGIIISLIAVITFLLMNSILLLIKKIINKNINSHYPLVKN